MFDRLFHLLRRKTSSTEFIPQIDGLRFLAVFVVVLFHMHSFFITKIPYAFTLPVLDYLRVNKFLESAAHKGVLLFFVISGFILGIPFAKRYWQEGKVVSLKSYFLRRLTRLEPPYILNILSSFFLIIFYKGHEFSSMFAKNFSGLLPSLASSLTYTHNIFFPHNLSVNPVAWSLEIEVQFYILVPLLVLILRLPKLYRRALLAFLIFFFSFLQSRFLLPVLTIYSFIQYFLLGFLLLDFYLSGFQIKLNIFFNFLLGLMALFSFFYIDAFRTKNFSFIFIFALFVLILLVLTNDFWKKVFSFRLFTSIGGMAYSVYLWHTAIISGIGNSTRFINISHSYPTAMLWHMAILLPFIVFISGVFYLLIEKPCMDKDWPIKLWRYLKQKFGKNKPAHGVLDASN